MIKTIKENFKIFLKFSIVFLFVTTWIFSGWPRIWQKPAIPPEIQGIKAADGSGTCAVNPASTTANATDKTFTFTFTAAETMDSGGILITVPAGWSEPQGSSNSTPGYTTIASTGVTADVLTALDSATGWSAPDSHITVSADTGDYQEGTASISASISASAQAGEKWYFNESSAKNFGSATKMIFWIKSSVGTSAGQLQFEVDDSADLGSPLDTVNIPALTANTWTEVTISLGGARSSVLSYGIKYTVDIGAATVKIDDIRAMFDDADATTSWVIDDGGKGSTLGLDGTIKQQGTYSITVSIAVPEKATKYYWSNASGRSFGSYTKVSFWIRSSVDMSTNDIYWQDDNGTALGSPEDSIDISPLSANTWKYIQVTVTNSSVQSYGISKPNDKQAHSEYIDAMAVQVSACDSATGWTMTTGIMTLSVDNTTYHENGASLKNQVTVFAGSGDKWWYNLGAAANWSGYTNVGFWIYSTVSTSAGDLQFEYDDNAGLASPIASLNIGALTASAWSYQNLTLTGTLTTINSYGFKYNTDIGATTINVDDILLGPGSPTFSGSGPWTISVRILALANTQTITVTYGDDAGSGGGVTVSSSEGDHTFTAKSRISDSGTLADISTHPVITVFPAVATISCSTNVASTAFPAWTGGDTSIKESSQPASTTMSCSNTSNGCTLYVKDEGSGSGSDDGLWNAADSELIESPTAANPGFATDTLANGAEGYGIQAATTTAGSGATLNIPAMYLVTGNDVAALTRTNQTLASSTADTSKREVVVTHKAAISESTFSGSYSDIITYECTLN